MSATVSQGLGITALGMALVFFTLGIVIVAMILLTKLPWLRTKEPAAEPNGASIEPAVDAPAARPTVATPSRPVEGGELAYVAAIAVAVLHSRRGARARTPQTAAGRSAWKSYGRANQLGL